MIDSLYTIDRGAYPLPAHIARCAQLAMCLEVSSSPKPGNIDRFSDYEDTRYEHFLASASAGIILSLRKAVSCDSGVGETHQERSD